VEAKRLIFAISEVSGYDQSVFGSRLAQFASPSTKSNVLIGLEEPSVASGDDLQVIELMVILRPPARPLFISQSRPPYTPYRRPQVSAKEKPKTSDKPCYSYVIKRECKDRDCKFSHDDKVCREFVLQRAADLLTSPFYPVNTHSRELQTSTQQRPAVLSCVETIGPIAIAAEERRGDRSLCWTFRYHTSWAL
jgi:hypothetical protein